MVETEISTSLTFLPNSVIIGDACWSAALKYHLQMSLQYAGAYVWLRVVHKSVGCISAIKLYKLCIFTVCYLNVNVWTFDARWRYGQKLYTGVYQELVGRREECVRGWWKNWGWGWQSVNNGSYAPEYVLQKVCRSGRKIRLSFYCPPPMLHLHFAVQDSSIQ